MDAPIGKGVPSVRLVGRRRTAHAERSYLAQRSGSDSTSIDPGRRPSLRRVILGHEPCFGVPMQGEPTSTLSGVARSAATINADLLRALADLERSRGDAVVIIEANLERRMISVLRGEVVGADSSARGERLGELLAAAGKLDPALIAPLAAEAQRRGRLMGDQLLADGLLTPVDLVQMLESQVNLRFERALTFSGS